VLSVSVALCTTELGFYLGVLIWDCIFYRSSMAYMGFTICQGAMIFNRQSFQTVPLIFLFENIQAYVSIITWGLVVEYQYSVR
jgi:hypothetical protein